MNTKGGNTRIGGDKYPGSGIKSDLDNQSTKGSVMDAKSDSRSGSAKSGGASIKDNSMDSKMDARTGSAKSGNSPGEDTKSDDEGSSTDARSASAKSGGGNQGNPTYGDNKGYDSKFGGVNQSDRDNRAKQF